MMKKLFFATLNIIATIFLSLTLIFILVRMTPGDPVEKIVGPEATFEQVQEQRAQLGLDLSIYEQFYNYIKSIISGNLGQSLIKKEDVLDMVLNYLPATTIIALLSVLFSFFIGTFIGSMSALLKENIADNLFRFFTLLCLSIPVFSLAPVLVLIFSIKLQWLPVSEWGGIKHAVLPIITLIVPLSAVLSRVSRNKYLEEVSSPWVKVLYAKGLGVFSIHLRVIKVILPTVLNVVAIQLSSVLAGTMITETIYDIPGMGSLLLDSIANRDYPVIQAVIIYSTVAYLIVYMLMESVNRYLDPRIKA